MQRFNASPKFPDEIEDYSYDWTVDLNTGEILVGEPAITVTAGVTVLSNTTVNGKTVVRLTGGNIGEICHLFLLATTNTGRKPGILITIPISDK